MTISYSRFSLYLRLCILSKRGFPSGSDGKESTCNAEDLGSIPGSIPELGRSLGGGHGNQLQYSCMENPHGQRSMVGCSTWGGKGSDTTERLSTHIQKYFLIIINQKKISEKFKLKSTILLGHIFRLITKEALF